MTQRHRDAALVAALLLLGAVIAVNARRGAGEREELAALPGAYTTPAGASEVPELHQRASRLMRDGRVAEADSVYRRIVALQPDEPAGHLGLGGSRFYLGDLQGAEQAYRAALALDSASSSTLVGLGSVAHRRARYAEAADLYGRAVRHAPDSPDAHWGLAISYEGLGRSAPALQHYERFLELAPGSGFAPAARQQIARLRGGS